MQNFGGTTKSVMVFLKKERLIGECMFSKRFLVTYLKSEKTPLSGGASL